MRAVLLDTHALLWWLARDDRLSSAASRAIARAETVLVSPVSCWEVAVLVERGRVTLDRDVHAWVRAVLADEDVGLAPLSPHTAVEAAGLGARGFHGDPADRFLYATAAALRTPFVTKDDRIRGFAATAKDVRVVW